MQVHQPSGGAYGQATDIQIQAEEILKLKKLLNGLYVNHTGADLEAIEQALDRDRFMSPEEALSFGLIDEVISKREVPEEAEQ